MLLDGGFKLNCPAACAYSEAKCIWPDKHRDILVSLGTGKAANPETPPARNKLVGLARAIIDDIADAEGAWDRFQTTLLQTECVFRLNPIYLGTGFKLDEFQKLHEIEKQTEEWMATQDASLTRICDQLIAALFFFRLGPIEDGARIGEIHCRLPTGLKERQNLVRAMRLQPNTNLFVVEYDRLRPPEIRMEINVAEAFGSVASGDELVLRVKLEDVPENGRTTIHAKMRSLKMPQAVDFRRSEWLPISGSPYVL
jgi:hypothetical protein